MIITILLLSLLIACIIIHRKYFWDNETIGIISLCVGSLVAIYLFTHLYFWLTSTIVYEQFRIKRQAFVYDLNNSRKNNRELESATILKDISQWNQDLASFKYQNTLWLIDDYIDDRIDTLEPIH